MRSERWWLLGRNLLTSLSTALGISPYTMLYFHIKFSSGVTVSYLMERT